MTISDRTKDKIRRIRVRNKVRAQAYLPPLSIPEQIGKMNHHEERMAFEAFVRRERSKYQHIMTGADGFMSGLVRHTKIMQLIRQDYERQRQS